IGTEIGCAASRAIGNLAVERNQGALGGRHFSNRMSAAKGDGKALSGRRCSSERLVLDDVYGWTYHALKGDGSPRIHHSQARAQCDIEGIFGKLHKNSSRFTVLSSQFSVHSSQFSVLGSQFSVLSSLF